MSLTEGRDEVLGAIHEHLAVIGAQVREGRMPLDAFVIHKVGLARLLIAEPNKRPTGIWRPQGTPSRCGCHTAAKQGYLFASWRPCAFCYLP